MHHIFVHVYLYLYMSMKLGYWSVHIQNWCLGSLKMIENENLKGGPLVQHCDRQGTTAIFWGSNGSQRRFSQRWVECKIIQTSRKNPKENSCSWIRSRFWTSPQMHSSQVFSERTPCMDGMFNCSQAAPWLAPEAANPLGHAVGHHKLGNALEIDND